MISDVPVSRTNNIYNLLYADDCVIWTSGNDIREMTVQIQTYLDVLNEWFTSRGLKISPLKTTSVLFSRGNKDERVHLLLEKNELKFAPQYRYLGVIFDRRMTWRPHLQDVVLRCKKRLNILKVLAHTNFCQSIQELLGVYRSLIRSIIDYACEAYDSATMSVKNVLNSIQYQALTICANAKKRDSHKNPPSGIRRNAPRVTSRDALG